MPRRSKARKAFLDVILVEVRGLLPPRRQGWRAWLPSQPPPISVSATVGRQRRHFSPLPHDAAIVWNEDATFMWTMLEEEEEGVRLRLKVEAEGVALAKGFVGLGSLGSGVADLWLPLAPLPPLGGAVDEAQAAGQAEVAAHLLLQRSRRQEEGLLAHLGRPMAAVPMRLQAGDVVLVSSSHPLTLGVKAASWSAWDHVAMVAQLPARRSLHLFEATMEGVAAYRLDEALATYLESSALAVRRLRRPAGEEARRALAEFVQEVRGRPYNASPWFLLRSGLGSHGLASDEEAGALFCSQLVGMALKRMGLLPAQVAASNLLPSHFAAAAAAAAATAADASTPPVQALAGLLAPAALVPRPPPAAQARDSGAGSARPCPHAAVADVRMTEAREARDADGRRFTAYVLEVRGRRGVHVVHRRYSDFAALHARMKGLYRGVPRLPPKTLGRGTSPSVVHARQRALQAYLDVLLDDRATRAAPPLLRFLGPEPLHSRVAASAPALSPPVVHSASTVPSTEALPQASTVPSTEALPQASTVPSTEALPQASTVPSTEALPQASTVPSTEALPQASTVPPLEALAAEAPAAAHASTVPPTEAFAPAAEPPATEAPATAEAPAAAAAAAQAPAADPAPSAGQAPAAAMPPTAALPPTAATRALEEAFGRDQRTGTEENGVYASRDGEGAGGEAAECTAATYGSSAGQTM